MEQLNDSEMIFARYVRNELTLSAAADELIALMEGAKAVGKEVPSVRPVGELRDSEAASRAQALFDEIDRRLSLG